MPATTPQFGLPYPLLTEPPNGPAALQDLAEAVENTLAGNTGWQTINGLVASTGWALSGTQLYRQMFGEGGLAVLALKITRTGATLTASSAGQFTDNAVATSMPVNLRPTSGPVYFTTFKAGTSTATLRLGTDGSLTLTDGTSNSTIAANAILTCHALIPLG